MCTHTLLKHQTLTRSVLIRGCGVVNDYRTQGQIKKEQLQNDERNM